MKRLNNISLEQCQDRHVYVILGRNIRLGVFSKNDSSFIGIRTKFGDQFLDREYHYDTGAPYGTVSCAEEVCELPSDIELAMYFKKEDNYIQNKKLFEWLSNKEEEINPNKVLHKLAGIEI